MEKKKNFWKPWKFFLAHNMEETKPVHYTTKEEVKELIDAAINQHNRNASIISMFLGIIFLALFAEGFFRVIGLIPPFMGIDVNVLHEVVEKVKSELTGIM